MKNLNKKTIGMPVILIGVLMLLAGSILAFGVSSQYWKDYPLKMYPGETKDVYIVLQNRAGATEDVISTGEITQGVDIAKLTGFRNEYTVPAGDEIKVNIRVSIPDEVEVGHKYDIILNFDSSPVSEEEGGPLGIGSSVEQIIPVLVIAEPVQTAEPSESNLSWFYTIIILIALVVLIVIILNIVKKRKPTKKEKSK